VVAKNGNSYSLGEEKLGVGRENAKKYLKDNPQLIDRIKKSVWEEVGRKRAEEE